MAGKTSLEVPFLPEPATYPSASSLRSLLALCVLGPDSDFIWATSAFVNQRTSRCLLLLGVLLKGRVSLGISNAAFIVCYVKLPRAVGFISGLPVLVQWPTELLVVLPELPFFSP